MMAGVGVIALGLVVMQADRTAKKNASTVSADRDIEEAMSILGTIFANPVSCNLALQGLNYSSSVTPLGSLKKAATDARFAIKFNDYDMFDRRLASEGGIATTNVSKNTKIHFLGYRQVMPQSTNSTGTRPSTAVTPSGPDSPNSYPASLGYKPALFNIVIRFTKKLGTRKLPDNSIEVIERVLEKVYIIDVPVVTSTYDYNAKTLTDSPTILGCAKSPASTFAYP